MQIQLILTISQEIKINSNLLYKEITVIIWFKIKNQINNKITIMSIIKKEQIV